MGQYVNRTKRLSMVLCAFLLSFIMAAGPLVEIASAAPNGNSANPLIADDEIDSGEYQNALVKAMEAAGVELDADSEIYFASSSDDDDDKEEEEEEVKKTPVSVKTDQAKTYSAKTRNSVPNAALYPLPKGTVDYMLGSAFTYKAPDGKKINYAILASGVRVETSDLKVVKAGPKNNSISSMSFKTPKDGYTYLTLKTKQKVPYIFSYQKNAVTITFRYTVDTPKSASLSSNPLFTKATWKDNQLTLTLAKTNGFMGFRTYYDSSGNLVFRFNVPPTSIKTARIAIDPGHGGSDIGAPGLYGSWQEKDINLAIAKKLEAELKKRGATVKLLNSAGYTSPQRPPMVEQWGADMLISVHSNTASSRTATGCEVYYFYPFSKQLASNSAAHVAAQMKSINRGAKWSYYHVTLSPQFLSVLVETGFMTNQLEYRKLTNSAYQTRVAVGISDAVEGAITSLRTGKATVGSMSKTVAAPDLSEEDESSTSSGSTVKVTGVKLDRTSAQLKVGKKFTLKATISPSNATNKNVTWKSSNSGVASVSSKGVVTAKDVGTAKITVTTKDGSHKATCTVKVVKNTSAYIGSDVAESIYIESETDTISIGETLSLGVSCEPDDAYEPELVWSSGNQTVATVDEDGEVLAVRAGTVTISARAVDDSSIRATYKITVVDNGQINASTTSSRTDTGISYQSAGDVRIYNDYLRLYPGTKERVEILSEDDKVVRNSDFSWSSSRTSIATVDSYGVITARGVGNAVITAEVDGYEMECEIEVTRTRTAVTAISLDASSLTVVKNSTKQIKATFKPSSATSGDVVWSSSNSRIASVDSTGNVKGLNAGRVTITCKARTGSVSATCEVEVVRTNIEIDYIELDETLEYYVGDEDQLDYYVSPDNATNSSVVWSSSNSRVVSVDNEGNIVALSRGSATIRVASASNSRVYSECRIKVFD